MVTLKENTNPWFYGEGDCIIEVTGEMRGRKIRVNTSCDWIVGRLLEKYLKELDESNEVWIEPEDAFLIETIERLAKSPLGTLLIYTPEENNDSRWYIEFDERKAF